MSDDRIPQDAQKLAAYLSISLSKLGDAIQPAHKNNFPHDVHAITPIIQILERVESALGDRDAVRAWLNRPVPELEHASPLEVILAGEAGAVATLLDNARSGIPG